MTDLNAGEKTLAFFAKQQISINRTGRLGASLLVC